MHPNPIFHTKSTDELLAFVRDRAFGQLSINGENGPLAAHVPAILSEDGKTAELHLMRSNPITRALATPQPALFTLSGPDGYISPDWYGVPDQVPTWNYVSVHVRGRLELLDQSALPAVLARQSAVFEARLAPKPEWRMGKVTKEVLERMMRMIVPFRLHIESVDGTWKLGQNKPDAVRDSAAANLTHGIGGDLAALAQLMRAISPDR